MPGHLSTSIALCHHSFQCVSLTSGTCSTKALKKGLCPLSISGLLKDAQAMTKPRVNSSFLKHLSKVSGWRNKIWFDKIVFNMLVKVRETVLNFKSRRKQGISIPSSALAWLHVTLRYSRNYGPSRQSAISTKLRQTGGKSYFSGLFFKLWMADTRLWIKNCK